MSDAGYFEKQRDLLLQEIGASLDLVVYNLDVLNRSLNGSVSVGKEFDNVGRLWLHFYDGANQLRQRRGDTEGGVVAVDADADADADGDADADADADADEDAAADASVLAAP